MIATVILVLQRENRRYSFDFDKLQAILIDGDIICRRGSGFLSDLIADISTEDKRFSHVGIVRIVDGFITVIHAEGSFNFKDCIVKEESLADFLRTARSVGIYRVIDFEGHLISSKVIEYLDKPFDWGFDIFNDENVYCTELVFIILKRLNSMIQPQKVFVNQIGRYVIPLESISNSRYFSEIWFYEQNK